ncbi:MAG: hypothetical protein KDC34_14345 [Saprospiraceae bacterium]|nr:hypothetical protein [Saprospiraceae bacterium]
MHIRLETEVDGNFREVIAAFDQRLFEALKPPLAKMEIVEFTGSQKGDRVHIRFLQPIKAEWISIITADEMHETEAWFTDEGTQLPWPLVFWKHQHLIQKVSEDRSLIVDNIQFRAKNAFLSFLLYPAIFMGFWPRKKIYRKYFLRG